MKAFKVNNNLSSRNLITDTDPSEDSAIMMDYRILPDQVDSPKRELVSF